MNAIPKVMKGIQLTGHGGLEKLVFRDFCYIMLYIKEYREFIDKATSAMHR
jgi:hypothetical protein